ncbi:MAG TPA: NAD(P)-dependent oxidoreductase [Arthrobacter sp.]|nr:NAD(P)-dependent oxidoreductase [Arthrobacter sp.]
MIGPAELALLRPGATLINTARGGIPDQDALEAEQVSGWINAILDVAVPDVLPPGHIFYELPNVFLTPHIAGSLGTELLRMGEYVCPSWSATPAVNHSNIQRSSHDTYHQSGTPGLLA